MSIDWTKLKTAEQIQQENHETQKQNVRNQRNQLLKETDWTALNDVPPNQAWVEYRQALRDITEQEGFPEGVVWPVKPE